VRHLKVSQQERQAHADRVAEVRARFDALGIPHVQNPGHIIPVIVGDAVKCKFISDILMRDYGIYIQPINYPTVPRGTERLRITPSPVHSPADIDALVAALSDLWTKCELARKPMVAQ
jgi:5-aminolevulinate synthase